MTSSAGLQPCGNTAICWLLTIDAETGERGYLLTRRDEYLAPYNKAVDDIPNTVAQLKATIKTEPGK